MHPNRRNFSHTLSTHPLNPPSQHALSTHPLHPSIHPSIHPPYPPTLSIHPLHPPSSLTFSGNIRVAVASIAGGAKVDAADENLERPIHIAAKHGFLEITKLLVEKQV